MTNLCFKCHLLECSEVSRWRSFLCSYLESKNISITIWEKKKKKLLTVMLAFNTAEMLMTVSSFFFFLMSPAHSYVDNDQW